MNAGMSVGALLAAAHRRNSAPFTPLSIAGCQLWLDASQIAGSLNNTDPVSTWNDLSGNAHDCTQSGAARPQYRTNVKNSLPSVLFGSGTYMTGSFSVNNPMTLFAVVQHSTTGANYEFICDGSTNRVVLARLTLSDGYDLFAGSDGTVARAQDTNWHYLGGVVNGASSVLSIDGTATTVSSGTNSLGSTFYLGSVASSPGTLYMNGYIAEFILYDSALGTTNRQLVEAYLAAKWAI